jgi:carbamoyl-phosphate synthase large subunit
MYTVLVTGVGAVIGYGILRSLRVSHFAPKLIGLDIYPDAVGKQWCDFFERAIPTAHPEYPDFLREVILKHRVDLVLPGVVQDNSRLAEELANGKTFSDLKARWVVNNPELLAVADDKWSTYLHLKTIGLPAIQTRIEGQFEELASALGVPMLLKPRRSYASKGIQRIHTRADLDYWRSKLGANFMVQEIVGTDEDEYTVGAFGLGDGTCAQSITFQRKLSGEGSTAKAKVRSIPALDSCVSAISKLFRPVGPTNFQFRLHKGEFLLLEINPRMSSSCSLRTAFGYNEAEMCLEYYLEGRRPSVRQIRSGCAVRYLEDVVAYDRLDF